MLVFHKPIQKKYVLFLICLFTFEYPSPSPGCLHQLTSITPGNILPAFREEGYGKFYNIKILSGRLPPMRQSARTSRQMTVALRMALRAEEAGRPRTSFITSSRVAVNTRVLAAAPSHLRPRSHRLH